MNDNKDNKTLSTTYNALYKRFKKKQSSFVPMPSVVTIIPPTQFNFNGNIEDTCCSFFGCGKILTLTEKLFGERCINHPKK